MKDYFTFLQRGDLLLSLAIKEIKVKYKSAILGFLWAIIVPISMMLVFLLIFSKLFNIKDLTPVYLLSALFPWMFLSQSLSSGTTCFIDNASIIKKIFFPREIIPLSIMLSHLFNFLLSMLLLIILAVIWRYPLSMTLFYLPFVILLQVLFVSGFTMMMSAFYVYFRDIKYFVEILLIVWFYLTPVFYDQKMIRDFSPNIFYLFLINPMTGLTIMYRDIYLYGIFSSVKLVSVTSLLCILTYIIGMKITIKLSSGISDYV